MTAALDAQMTRIQDAINTRARPGVHEGTTHAGHPLTDTRWCVNDNCASPHPPRENPVPCFRCGRRTYAIHQVCMRCGPGHCDRCRP